jgi:hypothetical protein
VTDRAWKNTERRIAALLGGERVPVTGRQRGNAPDVAHPFLAIEVKHRSILPAWIRDAVEQARASARGQQLPIVVLHGRGMRYDQSLVVIELGSLSCFLDLLDQGDRSASMRDGGGTIPGQR